MTCIKRKEIYYLRDCSNPVCHNDNSLFFFYVHQVVTMTTTILSSGRKMSELFSDKAKTHKESNGIDKVCLLILNTSKQTERTYLSIL